MIWLSSSTIARLRDQLRSSGERPSLVLAGAETAGTAGDDGAEWIAVKVEYLPFCEVMYLMMSADGTITKNERDVLAGALRNLSGDTVRSAQIDGLLEQAAKSAAEQGRDARLSDVTARLRVDVARAEVAFVLAAAVAFADDTIADEENEALGALARGLGIDDARMDALLDTVASEQADGARR